jgi:uncharacterized NAD(P)/FAD-binding protein YdhS
VEVVLLERRSEYRNAGVAYHSAGNHWHHVFNIQAGRMSAFREDVDDFVKWANHEADRSDWPPEWRDFEFFESGPAPRRIYPDYLATRLAEAQREAFPGVTLFEADGEAVDVEVVGNHVHVIVEHLAMPAGAAVAGQTMLEADHVVLATGLETKHAAFAANVDDHPAFVRHPYSESGMRNLLDVAQDGTVVVVGSLLSAYDVATLLLRRGHTGAIYLASRSGLTPRTYPSDHQHRVLALPAPQICAGGYDGQEALVRRLYDEWLRACADLTQKYPDVSSKVVTERVAKAWEPHLPELLEGIPSFELQALLDKYGSLLATLRVSAMAYTTDIVDAAMGGQVRHIAGRVREIRGTTAGRLELCVAEPTSTQTIEADLVVSNFGRESDYERVDSTLWMNLLRNKLACSHRRTGRGVEVDSRGTILGPAGGPSGPIWAVGCPREGDEIVRNGRLGAFSFNLAAIKNHSVTVAATIVRQLETHFGDGSQTLGDVPDQAFNEAIMLDARRMATRRRPARQALTTRLEETLHTLTANGTVQPHSTALRSAINATAITKLTDLSVTPRDLRSNLGLDTHS